MRLVCQAANFFHSAVFLYTFIEWSISYSINQTVTQLDVSLVSYRHSVEKAIFFAYFEYFTTSLAKSITLDGTINFDNENTSEGSRFWTIRKTKRVRIFGWP
jgi:hypothetical protein